MFTIILLSAIMILATIEDIMVKRVPIICFSLFCIYLTIITTYNHTFSISMIYGFLVGSVPFLLLSIKGHGGVGDIFMMGTLGYYLGIYYVDIVIIISLFLFLLVTIGIKIYQHIKNSINKRIELPFAPFALVGYAYTLYCIL